MAGVDDGKESDKVLQNESASTQEKQEDNDISTSRSKIVEVELSNFALPVSASPSPSKSQVINDILWCGDLADNLDKGLDFGCNPPINDSVFGLGVQSLPGLTSPDKFNEISPLKLPRTPGSDMNVVSEPNDEHPPPMLTPNPPNCKRSIEEQLKNDGQDPPPPKLTPNQLRMASPSPVSTPSSGRLSPRTKRLFRLEEPLTGDEQLKEQDSPSKLASNLLPVTSPPVCTPSSSQLSPRTKRLFRLEEPSSGDEQLEKEQDLPSESTRDLLPVASPPPVCTPSSSQLSQRLFRLEEPLIDEQLENGELDPSPKSTPTRLPVASPPPVFTPSSSPRTAGTKRLLQLEEPSAEDELSRGRSLQTGEIGGVEGPPYTFPPFPIPSPCSEDWRRTNVGKRKLLMKLNKMMDLTSENGTVFNSDPVFKKRTTGMFAKDYTSIFKPDVVPADAPLKEMKAKLKVYYSEQTKRLEKDERISRELAEATANSINVPDSVGQSRTYTIKPPKQISEPAPAECDYADDSTPPRSPKLDSTHPQDSDLIVEPEQGNVGKFLNHREPNLVAQYVPRDSDDPVPRITFFARRNIKAGEELTWDYNITTHQDHVQEQQPKENINPNPVSSAAAVPPTTAALEDKKSDDLKDECYSRKTLNTEPHLQFQAQDKVETSLLRLQ